MAKGKGVNLGALDAIGSGLDFLGSDAPASVGVSGLQVEHIHIEMIRPDPANPRRVLPQQIYEAFHNQQIRPDQAIRRFIDYTKQIAKQHGRGFSGVLDLLPGADEKEESNLTPEESTLRDLVVLASTLGGDNQVNPITVIEIRQGTGSTYLIETGERRYWATWILRELPGYDGDGTIPCLNVTGKQSVFRAARENTSRSGLNAIATARQIAILLLSIHDVEPPMGPVPNDWYRQALEVDLRGKRDYTSDILSAMGGINKVALSKYKALLNLCDDVMEIADRYNVDEFRLRPIASLPPNGQVEILRAALDGNWDGRQIEAACNKWKMGETSSKAESDKLPATATSVAKAVWRAEKTNPEDVAAALLESGHDVEIVRARLRQLRRLLDDAEKLLH